jgi:hypothetical protein
VNAVSGHQDSMVDPGSFLGLMAVYCISQLQNPSQSAPEQFQHALWKCRIATNLIFFLPSTLQVYFSLININMDMALNMSC